MEMVGMCSWMDNHAQGYISTDTCAVTPKTGHSSQPLWWTAQPLLAKVGISFKHPKILKSKGKNLLNFLKKCMFCDKVQGMKVSQVCRLLLGTPTVGRTSLIPLQWLWHPGKLALKILSNAAGFAYW